MRCIFCRGDSASSKSREHIIPQSLRQHLARTPQRGSLRQVQQLLAREVEKPFLESDAIRVLRFHQGLESKRRRVPSLTGLITPDIPAIVTLSSTRLYVGCSTDRVIRATDSVEKRPFTFTLRRSR